MRFQLRVLLISAVISFTSAPAIAKIVPPKPVAPVESNGVRYSVDPNGGDQYVEATDITNGRQLWNVRVFHTHFNPWLEADVQLVFITELKLVGGSLFVRDGKARCYTINLRNHRVHKIACTDGASATTGK